MLTHEIEARKRLHDHVMEDSDQRRSRVEKPNQQYALDRAKIRPARFVRMRTFAIAVKVNGRLSQTICLERGVLQGSILSPTLFLMVMDPLLRKLEQCSLGPCLGDLYCGAYAHADDIRTIATSRDTLDKQISVVEYFTELNALVLNANKCEVVMVSNTTSRSDVPICTIANHLLAPSLSVKCLGHWWSWDLSSDKAIEEALGKARRCFFFYGAIGAFDGQLNPLSGRAIFEVCVIPVLLYN